MGVAGAGVGGAGAVAGHHRPRPPPGQTHQVHLGAALGKPLVGEGMAESGGRATCEESPYKASRPALRAASGRPPARQRHDGHQGTGLTLASRAIRSSH